MNIILCKKNLARSITLLDFLLKPHLTLKLKVKIHMHIEQCNIVVIIKYEKKMKTLADTIS